MLSSCLLLLGHKNVNTLYAESGEKCRATEKAASGLTLNQVLDACEWRNVANLRYLNETGVDSLQLLRKLDKGNTNVTSACHFVENLCTYVCARACGM